MFIFNSSEPPFNPYSFPIFMKKILLIALFFLILFKINAQTDTAKPADTKKKYVGLWKKSVETGVNFNQASFSSNWQAGGVNSVALGTLFNGRALYQSKGISFDNNVQLQYGFLKNGGQGFRKNTDKIYLDTKIGYKVSPKWDLYAEVNFTSQFAPGNKYGTDSIGRPTQQMISRFLAPGYLTSSLGWEYAPADFFSLRLGFAGFRQTFSVDTALYHNVPENYGVAIHKKVKNEVDFVLTANFNKDLGKNMNLLLRLTTFTNYANPKVTDSRTDMVFTGKVNKLLSVNVTASVLYYQAQSYHIQYTQALSLGLSYMFTQFDDKK